MTKLLFSMLKKTLRLFGVDTVQAAERVSKWSIACALGENKLGPLVSRLRTIAEDVSNQYSYQNRSDGYYELKLRTQHAFQCSLMLRALADLPPGESARIADIGDSAGTHMLYLRELTKDKLNIDSISINLDQRAVEKIRARGFKAMLSRAEDLDLGQNKIDLFVCFQMVEHLHNPAVFFQRLSHKCQDKRLVITVPYLRKSRVGLHHIRKNFCKAVFAEEEHIFELSPEDWALLMRHSGWKVAYAKIYYQYPRKWPVISQLLARYWQRTDFEGFWGAILEKDTAFSECYKDWEKQELATSHEK